MNDEAKRRAVAALARRTELLDAARASRLDRCLRPAATLDEIEARRQARLLHADVLAEALIDALAELELLRARAIS